MLLECDYSELAVWNFVKKANESSLAGTLLSVLSMGDIIQLLTKIQYKFKIKIWSPGRHWEEF